MTRLLKPASTPLMLLAALLVTTGCASTPSPATVADKAAATPELSTLNQLITQAGMADTLRGPGPFTVFAPSNDAFKAVPKATMDALAKDPAQLKAVLGYHVLPAKVMSSDLKNGPAKTAQGANVALYKSGSFVTVEDAVVTSADLPASNGVVHIVDRVLVPPKK